MTDVDWRGMAMEVAREAPSAAGWLRIADYAMWLDEHALGQLSEALAHWPDELRTVRTKWVSGPVRPCLQLGRWLNVKSLYIDPAVIERIASSPHARNLVHVDLSNLAMRPNAGYYLAKIANAPHLSQLRSLTLRDEPLDDASLNGLVECDGLTQLEALDLGATGLTASAARLLATARLPCLRSLGLSLNAIGDEGTIALADATFAPNLRRLDLYGDTLTSEGTDTIVQSGSFRALQGLDVGCGEVDVRAAARLVDGGLPELRELGLAMMLVDAPLEDLLEAIRVPLTHLDLSSTDLQADQLRALSASSRLGGLESLFVSGNGIDDDGLELLTTSPLLHRVHTLVAKDNAVGVRGLRTLLRAPRDVPLRCLELDGNPVGDEGLRMLAEWPAATHLHRLGVRRVRSTEDGYRGLLDSPYLSSDVRKALEIQVGMPLS